MHFHFPLIALALPGAAQTTECYRCPIGHVSLQQEATTDIIKLSEIDDSTLQALLAGELSDAIIHIEHGLELPLNLRLDGETFSVEPVTTLVRTHKSLYVRQESGNLFLSHDLQHWLPLEDFFHGQLSLSVNSEQEVEVSVSLN